MASKSVCAGNSLSLLLGEYKSDSEEDDNENSSSQLNDKLQEFLTDLNTILTTNWTQCIDPESGHPYYWNTLTKEVTWDMPAEYDKFQQQNLRSNNSNNKNTYTVCYTDEKVPYYVNEFTRQVSWEKPTGFVEPKIKLKEKVKKSKKVMNSTVDEDERNGHKKKSKKPDKISKKYPFEADDDLDHLKIELISSFPSKSDSSSEEEVQSKKTKTNFNLVANDYNSDDNSDNERRIKTITNKPLFASLSSTVAIDAPTVKIYSIKTDLVDNITQKIIPTDEPEEPRVVEKPPSMQPKPNTFASIITGGRRSPNDQDNELIQLMKLEVTETQPQPNVSVQVDKPMELDLKTFKRKRRIEFMTRPVAPTKPTADIADDFAVSVTVNDSAKESVTSDVSNVNSETATKPSYSNFLRAGVESSGVVDQINNEIVPESVVNDELNKQKSEISELRTIIESKLKFLCNGRPDVSAVQAIFIQFETLLEAYDVQALQPAYMQRWLNGISTDLWTLENDAAPNGWKCLWNRKKSQYCYKNLTTGDIRWDYPTSQTKSDETVEMDMEICTTPPPNVDEHLNEWQKAKNQKRLCDNGDDNATAYNQAHNDDELLIPPPPPNISLLNGEPPPPGTDFESSKEKPSEKINSELASFYSEMASIDTDSTPTTELPASSSELIKPSNENTDGVVKKKKKKVKKSEPWRSGNLETWINKWQKAQKELDG